MSSSKASKISSEVESRDEAEAPDEELDEETKAAIARRDQAHTELLEELRLAVLTSDKTQRQIEKENGYKNRYLSQVLTGRVTLTARHVLGMLQSLDTAPGDFFSRLFGGGETTDEISEIRQKLTRYDSVIRELEAKGLVSPAEEPGESPSGSGEEDG